MVFMSHQDFNKDGIVDEEKQLSSYFEFPDPSEQHITSGDAIGTQYQALLAFSEILKSYGKSDSAAIYKNKADSVKAYFETYCYNHQEQRYMFGMDRYMRGNDGFGREASYFIPMTLIGDNGNRIRELPQLLR